MLLPSWLSMGAPVQYPSRAAEDVVEHPDPAVPVISGQVATSQETPQKYLKATVEDVGDNEAHWGRGVVHRDVTLS